MKLEVYESGVAAASAASDLIAQRISGSATLVLGLATGSTMEPLYHHLVEHHTKAGLSFGATTTFNLDEYVGLHPTHPASYRATMQRLLFEHVDLDMERTHLLDGMAGNWVDEANRYETAITQVGGIDLQLLGMGRNGHIAFNEPGTSFESRTHIVTLDSLTRSSNAHFFPPGESVPTHAITMGIRTILDAREIVLVVTGAQKQTALANALCSEVNPACPASVLQLHPKVHIFADRASAAGIVVG